MAVKVLYDLGIILVNDIHPVRGRFCSAAWNARDAPPSSDGLKTAGAAADILDIGRYLKLVSGKAAEVRRLR